MGGENLFVHQKVFSPQASLYPKTLVASVRLPLTEAPDACWVERKEMRLAEALRIQKKISTKKHFIHQL